MPYTAAAGIQPPPLVPLPCVRQNMACFLPAFLLRMQILSRHRWFTLARFQSHIQHTVRGDDVITLGLYMEHHRDYDGGNAPGMSI